MRLPSGLCAGPRRGACSAPRPPAGKRSVTPLQRAPHNYGPQGLETTRSTTVWYELNGKKEVANTAKSGRFHLPPGSLLYYMTAHFVITVILADSSWTYCPTVTQRGRANEVDRPMGFIRSGSIGLLDSLHPACVIYISIPLISLYFSLEFLMVLRTCPL